jgi:DNA (cytosine-5)-methyltransferase 1
MKFIDLFAGLGGFHVAMSNLGHDCVFASEIKEGLVDLYEGNFGIRPHGDIRKIKAKDIPTHDILCAGFPCQPFSKAGMQLGLEDETNGDLFGEIIRILRYHQPKYFILENVQHLAKHDNEETYISMASRLKRLGYTVDGSILSPHEYNIPQHRQRLFIVGSQDGLTHFTWPERQILTKDVNSYLDANIENPTLLEIEKQKCLDVWQEFLDAIPVDGKLPGFPIWAMEFGATYPFENQTPQFSSDNLLGRCKGVFGTPLKGLSRKEKLSNLPSYAIPKRKTFPSWKKSYIRSNREFYEKYKKRLGPIVKKIEALGVPSWQKFEWNIQGGERKVRNYIIQFRGSGIRLKRTDFFPSLVCVSTQIPIVGWQGRYITKQEGARLQGLDSLEMLPENNGTCFDALGNAVNADIVRIIAERLILFEKINGKANGKHIMPSVMELHEAVH